jgi:polyhydroxyalkanoate synthesis regulator phasin
MTDAWRAYLEMALGASEASKKRAQKVAKRLVGKGGATAAQIQTVAEDLVATSTANREAITKLVRFEVDRALGVVGLATADEVGELTNRVHELERELRDARARAAAAEAGAPPVKKAAVAEPPVKKAVAKKTVAKKAVAPATPESPAKTTVAQKAVAKKTVAKKTVAKKAAPARTTSPASATAADIAKAVATPAPVADVSPPADAAKGGATSKAAPAKKAVAKKTAVKRTVSKKATGTA